MLRQGNVVVTVSPNDHQLRCRPATRQNGDQVDGRIVDPLQIFEHDDEGASGRDCLQRIADLTQHSRTRGAEDFTPQDFATVRRPFTLRHPSETLVEFGERALTPYQNLGGTRRRRAPRRRALGHVAMNRYPRRDSVSMKMGFLASSPRTARMAAMWLFNTSG